MGLKQYKAKRNFGKTPEPEGHKNNSKKQLRFIIQRHNASHLHYDFRLEMDNVLKSWAVPKGPSLNPNDKRLAVMVEDHPIEYGKFKGIIPEGNYGAGTVEIWDNGTYTPLENRQNLTDENELMNELKKGDLKFILHGKKIKGAFALVRMNQGNGKNWLLIKKKDNYSTTDNYTSEAIKPLIPLNKKEKLSPVYKKKNSTVKDGNIVKKNFSPEETTFTRAVNKLDSPMLAEYVNAPFNKAGWLFEYKWDGYRIIAAIENGNVQLFSRNRLSQNVRFPMIVNSLKLIKDTVIIDGEVVAENNKAKHSFQLLQNFQRTSDGKLVYYIFDLLYLNGHELTEMELIQRKELLNLLFKKYKPQDVRLSDYVEEKGIDLFKKAKKNGMEGIIAKDSHGLYELGHRSSAWLKIKAFKQQEAIICGFTRPRGSREKFGSLILGVYYHRKLSYSGHCGTGFDSELLNDIYKKLQPLIQTKCPFEKVPVTNEKATWVKSQLICNVKFTQLTQDRQFRNPVFLGLRTDKKPQEVQIEIPEKLKSVEKKNKGNAIEQLNVQFFSAFKKDNELSLNSHKVKLTNLDKLYWKKEKISKGDLIDYYLSIEKYIVPYLKDRPQTLHRFPNGIEQAGFYQKDIEPKEIPSWLQTKQVYSESNKKYIEYLVCKDIASLIYMVNLGCIEINPWNSRIQNPENPDYMIIDLDPGTNSFKEVVKTAIVVKEVFDEMNVPSYCKTSGATGLHVYSPLGAKYDYDIVRKFAEIVANEIHQRLPNITSLVRNPAQRRDKIYVDFLQNRRGQTLAAPYSVRPRPFATVSTPLNWDEVNSSLNPLGFTIKNTLARLSKVGDLWMPVLKKGFDIPKILNKINK